MVIPGSTTTVFVHFPNSDPTLGSCSTNCLPYVRSSYHWQYYAGELPQSSEISQEDRIVEDDLYFWKQMGKALICTYAVLGAAWLWNETSPLGWWTLKPRPKEETEMAHLYERRKFPYPGDKEAMEEFVKSGGTIGTTIGPKGFVEANMGSESMEKRLQTKKFDQEALKLWVRMRNEVIQELQDKGFEME